MKRPSKKTIQTVLRTMDITAIHHVAHKFGINPKHHGDVFDFSYANEREVVDGELTWLYF